MPLRSWVQRSMPGMLSLTRRGVEHPDVGVPGVCNFVDGEWSDLSWGTVEMKSCAGGTCSSS